MEGSTTDAIGGVADGTLYKSERYGQYRYEIPVTNATYSLALHFAELYHNGAGLRSFNVSVEGRRVLSNVDLYSLAGHDGAYNYIVDNINVGDKSLTIDLETIQDNATINGFAIYSANGGRYEEPAVIDPGPRPQPGKKFVGNITTTTGNVHSSFGRYWNQITPENEGKWGSVEGSRDNYNWGPLDKVYDYARKNGIPVKAHTLVWGSQAPGWINGLSAADQRAEIEEWISDYCKRYPDTAMIDVVNEAHPDHAPANYARNAYGNNWITRSFELARKHCPNAVLIYNDYNFMTWNTEEIINEIQPALNAGVIDALGMQAHSLYSPKVWSAQEIKSKLDRIGRLGLPIYISEYDIEATDDQTQLNYMKMHFPVFYEHPKVVGVTFWGFIYGQTCRGESSPLKSIETQKGRA